MRIITYASYTHLKQPELSGKNVIVIDALRATTTIIEALKNGCKAVIPTDSIEKAVLMKKSRDNVDIVLGGESGCVKVAGFDLGNSPMEYVSKIVRDKTVILYTTNGTKCILTASGAKNVYIGAYANVSVLMERIPKDRELVILCSGTQHRFSADDILAAGAMIDRLVRMGEEVELDDLSIVAQKMYRYCEGNVKAFLSTTHHYNVLKQAGFQQDLDFCLTEDTADIIPILADSQITL